MLVKGFTKIVKITYQLQNIGWKWCESNHWLTQWATLIRHLQIFISPRTRIRENWVHCRNRTAFSSITPDSDVTTDNDKYLNMKIRKGYGFSCSCKVIQFSLISVNPTEQSSYGEMFLRSSKHLRAVQMDVQQSIYCDQSVHNWHQGHVCSPCLTHGRRP